MLISAVLLTALALRSRLLRGTVVILAINAAIIGVVGVVAHLLVYRWLGRETALLVFGTVLVTLVSLGAARTVWSAFTTYRERASHLATLGRLSAQMAHDIRNPLAAIRGAAQYLDTERERGARIDEHREFLDLILEQTDRLERVVRDYQRIGRAEPARTDVDVVALVRSVVEGARVSEKAARAKVSVSAEVTRVEPQSLDADLVSAALENLVRNAIEAMEERSGGGVRVRAEQVFTRGTDALVLSVVDDGPGMDARTREQAQEAFFTTKAEGSGLGLAFVRRVAEAHGGQLQIESRLGRGTTVTLVIPCDARTSAV
jgi:signal transduction histidine kinase